MISWEVVDCMNLAKRRQIVGSCERNNGIWELHKTEQKYRLASEEKLCSMGSVKYLLLHEITGEKHERFISPRILVSAIRFITFGGNLSPSSGKDNVSIVRKR